MRCERRTTSTRSFGLAAALDGSRRGGFNVLAVLVGRSLDTTRSVSTWLAAGENPVS
ncbi:MAG: hypothetical protein JNN27_14695 [Planctomycetes bacterium]|nr:hypothetical protein [Planctomycetota bacterium]